MCIFKTVIGKKFLVVVVWNKNEKFINDKRKKYQKINILFI